VINKVLFVLLVGFLNESLFASEPTSDHVPELTRNPSETKLEDPVPQKPTFVRRSSNEAASVNSVKKYTPITPSLLFDREKFMRERIQTLVEEEKSYGKYSYWCGRVSISLNVMSALSTITSLFISSLGASEYMEPRLANILNIGMGITSAGFLWGSMQAKKVSHSYHDHQVKIQTSLGVPNLFRSNEEEVELDKFDLR
jgi:hypothetical protein